MNNLGCTGYQKNSYFLTLLFPWAAAPTQMFWTDWPYLWYSLSAENIHELAFTGHRVQLVFRENFYISLTFVLGM